MPLLIASEIYGESTEDPPKNEPPLEARKVRFHWSAASNSGPESNTQSIEEKGEWIVRDPDGVDAAYMFRYDMVNGGRRARTYTENDIEHCVREFVRVNDKFEGWQVAK